MTQVWQSAEAKEPGALLAIPPREGHDAHLIVLNEMRELLRLRLTGEVLDRRTPDFSHASYVTELRTAVDRGGRRWFAAFTPMGRHVEIFDEHLQPRAAVSAGRIASHGHFGCAVGRPGWRWHS